MIFKRWPFLVWFFLAPFLLLPGPTQAQIIISEFAAVNSNGLKDEDGAFSDWIELFNTATTNVNLDGWFLTDSSANLLKWRIPATNLGPNTFLIVFASGKNRAVPGAPLHANFSLSAGGEYLALVKPDGLTIATEFSPTFPEQFANVTYGIAQNVEVTSFVSNTSPALLFIPTNGNLGKTWIAPAFIDASWQAVTNGIGFESYVSGFAVKNVRANIGVCDLATADSVLTTPSQQAAVFTENRNVVNYVNTGGGANFGGDNTFPGLTINVDVENFALEATGIITIPSSGQWTFGVNSDDGFRVIIGANEFSYPSPRGPGDTLATFNLTAGEYPVRLVFYECGGGSEVEFFAAAGTFSSFAPSFRLVGDVPSGGLAVKSLRVAGGNSASFRSLIVTDVQTQMLNRATSAYVRFPFAVADPAQYSSLTLRMKYNDGFVAYLNGVEIARRNVPATPAWNSTSVVSRSAADTLAFEDIDVSSRLGLLQPGQNVLAIHGLNYLGSSPEFLILPQLVQNKVLGLTNHYFATPTPGSFNSTESYAFVDNLKFTPGRGWFANTNLSVSITSSIPGITIRYTIDGSAPTTSSGLIYTGPIPVTNTTAIRAIGYKAGFEPNQVETHSYIVLDQVQRQSTNNNYVGGSSADYTTATNITQGTLYGPTFQNDLLTIPTLSIAMAWEDVFGVSGVWSNPNASGVAWERPCSIEYMRPDGGKGFSLNCGIRIQGGASRGLVSKHGLRLLFKTVYGPGKLAYNLYPDSSVQEFDTLTMHASFNDHWIWVGAAAQMQRDLWCRDTQNAMGSTAPHGTYAHIYINGLYWGLYNIGEKGDASFASHYLGGEKEEYDALNSDELVDGNMDAWNTMFSIANAGITNDLAYTNLSQYLNVPDFIDYMLLNFYAANVDWPGHNWNAARRRVPGAGYHFFSWDAEWTLGIGSDVNTDRTGVGANDGSPSRLYAGLRLHPEFLQQFGDHVQKACFDGGVLTSGMADARWMKRALEIDRAIVGESARWGFGYDRQAWITAQSSVRSWFQQRAPILLTQLRNAGLYPQLNAPVFSQHGGLVPPNYSLSIPNSNANGTVYYTLDGSDPRLWGGALSPTAKLYAGALTLTNAVFVRARVLDGTKWSALVEATFYILQDFSALAVTEIMYHPPNLGAINSDEMEFIELKNTGTNVLDLSGLSFTAGITFSFTNGTALAPSQFFVVVRNPAGYAARYPGASYQGVYSGRLDNNGEKLTLSHVLGTNLLSFSYNTRPPWPVTPDGLGFSLVRSSIVMSPDSAAAWRASTYIGGSPGADDPAPIIPKVVINEILTHTDPPAQDAIELQNLTVGSVDISGWFLSDDALLPTKFRIPSGTVLSPYGFAVFYETNFNSQPGVNPSFALSSTGESIYLFSGDSATTNLTGYSYGFDFGAAANGVSFSRQLLSTGEEDWTAQSGTTLGGTNAEPLVGPIVINEIMYHPAAGYEEFVELYNLSGSPIPLYDPMRPTNQWKLSGLGYVFSNNVTMPAQSYLLIVNSDPGAFRAKYGVPGSIPVLGPYAGVLQDSGERLRLERPDNPNVDTNGAVVIPYIVVDEVRYNDRLPWPLGADGNGPSLQRRTPFAYGNEPTNWFASGVTPGATNLFNVAPNCAVVSPTNGSLFTVPATFTITATASDVDGSIRVVEFYDGETKLGESTNAPYSFYWPNVPIGSHSLVAKARDNGLAVGISSPVSVTVDPPPLGNGIGLRADYFDNIDFTGTRVRRIDPTVNFDWGGGSPDPAIGPDSFSARWVGQVQPRFSETYTFFTYSDDGVRLWVNNQLLVDNWTDHGYTENAGLIALQAGYLYDIKMEFYENGGGAAAKLWWSSPNVFKDVIPSTQLYPPSVTSNLPPIVALTNPAPESVFVSGGSIALGAGASDLDGAIAKVAFYGGSLKLGEVLAAPYTQTWSNAPIGAWALTAVATDDGGTSRTSAPVNITVLAGFTTNVTLVATGSVWKYRDTGENLGSAWTGLGFVDTNWASGPAELGYGDVPEGRPERTVVSYGPDAANKYITTYFRTYFNVTDPNAFDVLNFRVMRDDGVLIYINGSEVFRNNMPGGPVGYLTTASVGIGGADESTFYPGSTSAGYLVFGTNVIAAEIHQSSGGSSDISFDFELMANRTVVAPYITNQPLSQAVAEGTTVTLGVAAQGTDPLRYQWRFNGANILGATNTSLVFPAIVTNQAGGYSVVITNAAGSATSAVASVTVSVLDTDGDGIPDLWEKAHGLNYLVNDANLDPDHDGMTNLQEYLAGTDPQSGTSYLKVDRLALGVNGSAITFLAISNHTYSVLANESLNPTGWTNVGNISARGTNRTEVILDGWPSNQQRYYRLVTPAMP